MHAGALLTSLVGILPALSLRIGKELPDLPGEHGYSDEASRRNAAIVDLNREEEEADAQAPLAALRELVSGDTEEWESSIWPAKSPFAKTGTRHCRTAACKRPRAPLQPDPSRRPYIFVMGIEGAGHHALCPLLQTLLDHSGFKVHTAAINMFGRLEIMPYGTWKSKFLDETRSWCPDGVCLNCLDSFPYERPMQPSSSPDFSRMAALHEEGLIDLRVISVMRSITDSVMSGLRRFSSDHTQAFAFTRHFFMEVVRNTERWQGAYCERLGTLRYEDLVKRDFASLSWSLSSLIRTLGIDQNSEQAKSAVREYISQNTGSHGHLYRSDGAALYDKVSSWFEEKEPFLWPEVDELWCQ